MAKKNGDATLQPHFNYFKNASYLEKETVILF
jgi:hypothetical protein